MAAEDVTNIHLCDIARPLLGGNYDSLTMTSVSSSLNGIQHTLSCIIM